jgi:hypothetical protein
VSSSPTSNAVQKGITANRAKTPKGAIAGGIAGGIATLVFVMFFLSSWRRRRRRNLDALQREGDPPFLITSFNIGRDPPAVSAPRMADLQSQIRSKAPIAAPQLLNQTGYNSGYFGQGGAGSSQRDGSSEFLGNLSTTDAAFSGHEDHHNSHPSTPEQTREKVRHERQEELDHRLRVVQREMEQLTGSTLALRHTGEEGLSVTDMRMEMSMMREQIALLRAQQQSAWALGLSDDPPPGYTPMETRRT